MYVGNVLPAPTSPSEASPKDTQSLEKNAYPLPRVDDTLAGSKLFSTLDLATGYWQVEVANEDKNKTAFSTPEGLYQFAVMPFALCIAPATFQRLMDKVLSRLKWYSCLVYICNELVKPITGACAVPWRLPTILEQPDNHHCYNHHHRQPLHHHKWLVLLSGDTHPTPHQFPTVLDTSSQLSVSPASPSTQPYKTRRWKA